MSAVHVPDTGDAEDRAYDEYRARLDDAPIPQACHACGHKYAGAACPICKEERPAFTALKKSATARAPYPTCRYFPKALCGCDGRGECLEAA